MLVILPLLFYWRLLTPDLLDRGSFPHGDFSVQFYAFACYQAARLGSGQVPLWSDGAYSGFPFLADIQSAVLYPPRLLTIALASPWGFPYLALEMEAVLHFCLTGAFAFLLGRRLFAHDGVALLTALVFTFSGYLTSYPSQQLAILESVTWLPLALLFADKAVCEPKVLNRWSLLCGAALGMSLLAGHPQTAMFIIYMVIAYTLWRRPDWRSILMLLAALVLAIGLAAAQLLPAAEYMRLSVRAQGSYDETSAGLPVPDVVQMLLPGSVSGYSPLYLGILPLLLVGAALILKPERPVRFWFAVAVVALLVSFGNQAFLHSIFYLFLPGWSLFRGQERLALMVAFSLSLLAGYGAEALLVKGGVSQQERLSFARSSARLTQLLLVAVALFFLGLLKDGWVQTSSFYWLLGSAVFVTIVSFLSWALLCWWAHQPRRELAFVALAASLIGFDLFTVGWRHNFSVQPPQTLEMPPAAVAAIRADAGAEAGRIFNEWRLDGNYGVQFGLQDIWGASPLRLARYEELLRLLPKERLWPLLNVHYVITWAKELPLSSQVIYQEPADQNETTYVHRLNQPGARAWLVHQAEQVAPAAVLERLAAPDFDPWQTALLEQPLAKPLAPSNGAEDVHIVAAAPESLTISVIASSEALLVLSEVYYPGWRASVDGTPTPLLRADYVLRAVPVPAGSHQVELRYQPWTWRLGVAVSALSLVALVVGTFLLNDSRWQVNLTPRPPSQHGEEA
ncbi:MAG: YfhO family protein [Anaerolineae bacterium]